jgi:hypothetical protein
MFYQKWQTNNLMQIWYRQLIINLKGWFNIGDFSNQYGNGPLLDRWSVKSFWLACIVLITWLIAQFKIPLWKRLLRNITSLSKLPNKFSPSKLKVKNQPQVLAIFYLVLVFSIASSLVSLTESPPLSTRLLILYPIVTLFIAFGIHQTTEYLTRHLHRLAGYLFLTFTISAIVTSNLTIYFHNYTAQKNPYYQWIEPNSSIGFFARNSQADQVFLLSNPHTYSNQPIIQVINYPKSKITDLRSQSEIDPILNQIDKTGTQLIIPLVPQNAITSNLRIQNSILNSARQRGFQISSHSGIPCKGCNQTHIFTTVKKP